MLTDRFSLALTEAEQLHRRQLRKGTSVPYVSHLLSVAALVLEHGGDEDQAIAALLHDSIEDCSEEAGGAVNLRERLSELFGPRILAMIEACTDAETLPKPPWKERKVAHLQHMQTVAPEVLLIIAADKLHNALSIRADLDQAGRTIWDRFKAGREGTLWYYAAVSALLTARLPNPITQRLSKAVAALQTG